MTRSGAGVVIESGQQQPGEENSLQDNSSLASSSAVGRQPDHEDSILRNSDGLEGGIHLVPTTRGGSDRTVVSENTLGITEVTDTGRSGQPGR